MTSIVTDNIATSIEREKNNRKVSVAEIKRRTYRALKVLGHDNLIELIEAQDPSMRGARRRLKQSFSNGKLSPDIAIAVDRLALMGHFGEVNAKREYLRPDIDWIKHDNKINSLEYKRLNELINFAGGVKQLCKDLGYAWVDSFGNQVSRPPNYWLKIGQVSKNGARLISNHPKYKDKFTYHYLKPNDETSYQAIVINQLQLIAGGADEFLSILNEHPLFTISHNTIKHNWASNGIPKRWRNFIESHHAFKNKMMEIDDFKAPVNIDTLHCNFRKYRG